jgi:putative cardiolipin synthase
MLMLIEGCATGGMKDDIKRMPASFALAPADNGILAEVSANITSKYGEEYSGFHLLDKSSDGLNWRLALMDSAVSSLDVQTYLWYPDNSGVLLLERAILAAERGVKVRLIVDDLLLQGVDQFIVNMNAHPNIEFRIFNPWTERGSTMERAGQALAEMERINTRMHDKLMIVDSHAVIVGGRNNGDHYFGLSEAYNFVDTDLLGVGEVALQSNEMFDRFWNSEWVVAAANLETEADKESASRQWQAIQDNSANAPELASFPRQPRDWSEEIRAEAAKLRIGRSKLIFDDTAPGRIERNVASTKFNLFDMAQSELLIMNAYVIPAQSSIDFMQKLQNRGVDVTILTNSLASHDVPAVNSHYEPWRDDLIGAGVELYELRPDGAIKSDVDMPPVVSGFIGLHSKTAVIDRRYTFVGSMNLDPRSANINTEMGVVVDSPDLAEDLARIIERNMQGENAWHVRLDDDGSLNWQNSDETVTQQPARDGMQRVMNVLMKLGPVEQF